MPPPEYGGPSMGYSVKDVQTLRNQPLSAIMVSQKIYDLCHSDVTVSSELARDPTLAPGHVVKKLHGSDLAGHDEHKYFKEPGASAEDLQRAFECGKWGNTRPSDLFLKVDCYIFALKALTNRPPLDLP